MTKQDKLTKLIEIAVDSGWNDRHKIFGAKIGEITDGSDEGNIFLAWLFFSHDFAKAIWGEAKVNNNGWTKEKFGNYADWGGERWCGYQKRWQFHIQQAVISDDPLTYYWKNK